MLWRSKVGYFSSSVKSATIQKYLIMEPPEKYKFQTMSKNINVIVSDSKKASVSQSMNRDPNVGWTNRKILIV